MTTKSGDDAVQKLRISDESVYVVSFNFVSLKPYEDHQGSLLEFENLILPPW